MQKKFWIAFTAALIFRLLLLFIAYHGDLNNNISWGTLVQARGLVDFYEGGNWPYSAPNQPPLTILLFALVRFIWQGIENVSWSLNLIFSFFPSPFIWFWEEKGMILLIKLPSVLADLGIGWLIYTYFRDRSKLKLGLILSTVWLFNPLSWYNSAIWGQTDAIVNLLGILAVFSLIRKKLVSFGVFITLSILFKASLIIFLPILFFFVLWQKYAASRWIKTVGVSLAIILISAAPFHPKLDLFSWFINLYKGRILPGEIGYLSANAFKFWWLVNPGRILDSTQFFGIPARILGITIIVFFLGAILVWLRRKVSDKNLLLSLAATSLFAFLFLTRIHPRYLYPFFPLATILLGLVPSIVPIYITLSVTHLLNIYYLFWAPSITTLENLYLNPAFPSLLSLINLASLLLLLRLLASKKI